MQTIDNDPLDARRAPAATRVRPMPHPAAVILLWLLLAVGLQSLQPPALWAAGAVLMSVALVTSFARLSALLRRTRWIMLSLLLIYGYATPGQALWADAGAFGPTREGLADGTLQLGRLAFALAGLAIALLLLPQHRLMAGVYALAYPLRFFGLSRERLAVRLALTLHYAETAMLDPASGWRQGVARMLESDGSAQGPVELNSMPVGLRDILLVVAGCCALAWVLL